MKVTYDEHGREVNEPAAEPWSVSVQTAVGKFPLTDLTSMFARLVTLTRASVQEWDSAPADSPEEHEIAECLFSDLSQFHSDLDQVRLDG